MSYFRMILRFSHKTQINVLQFTRTMQTNALRKRERWNLQRQLPRRHQHQQKRRGQRQKIESDTRFFSNMREWIKKIVKSPLAIHLPTSVLLVAGSDILCQQMESKHRGDRFMLNWKRTAASIAFGILLGAAGFKWYLFLDERISKIFANKTAAFVLTKVAIDTAVFNPIYLACYFLCHAAAADEPLSMQSMSDKLDEYAACFAVDCVIWPPVQIVNFWFIRPEYHLVLVNTLSFVENIGFSFLANNKLPANYWQFPDSASEFAIHARDFIVDNQRSIDDCMFLIPTQI